MTDAERIEPVAWLYRERVRPTWAVGEHVWLLTSSPSLLRAPERFEVVPLIRADAALAYAADVLDDEALRVRATEKNAVSWAAAASMQNAASWLRSLSDKGTP